MPTRHPANRHSGALAAITTTLLIIGFGFAVFGFTSGLFAALYMGLFAAYAALPYTVLAIAMREITARRGRRVRATLGDRNSDRSDEAMRFGRFSQRASLTTAIVMLVALLVQVVLGGPWDEQTGSATNSVGNMSLALFGAFAVVASALAIVVNAPSIFASAIVGAERRAVRERIGAWKLILATTVLTTTSWIAYCGFAMHILIHVMWQQ
ncbi:hypothetical protein ASF30_04695 [Leifsonia sp. Leaf264]|nr:hypothetical protein ASF30_04695 [Leifsonia sp. Leaf264]